MGGNYFCEIEEIINGFGENVDLDIFFHPPIGDSRGLDFDPNVTRLKSQLEKQNFPSKHPNVKLNYQFFDRQVVQFSRARGAPISSSMAKKVRP